MTKLAAVGIAQTTNTNNKSVMTMRMRLVPYEAILNAIALQQSGMRANHGNS